MPTAAEFRKAAEYLREKPFPVQVREVCALLLAAAAQSEASEDDRLVLAALKDTWQYDPKATTNDAGDDAGWEITIELCGGPGFVGTGPTLYAAILDAARKAGPELDQP